MSALQGILNIFRDNGLHEDRESDCRTFKAEGVKQNLVKAAAMLMAEVERIEREEALCS